MLTSGVSIYPCNPFVIGTNHENLCHLQDQSMSTEMHIKAIVKLAGLQFKLQYKTGLDIMVADALSRVGHSFSTKSTSAVCGSLDSKGPQLICSR
jgi:hypothetical protein